MTNVRVKIKTKSIWKEEYNKGNKFVRMNVEKPITTQTREKVITTETRIMDRQIIDIFSFN